MNKINRCTFINKNNKICKHKSKKDNFIFQKKCCGYHLNIYGKIYATYIQRIYRGYKCRKYLNKIYKNVPDDVQNIINYYIKEEQYIINYLKVLTKIVVKNMSNFICYMDMNTRHYNGFVFQLDMNSLIDYSEFIFSKREYIMNNYKLYYKYKELLKKDMLIKTKGLTNVRKNPEIYLYETLNKLKDYMILLNCSLFYYEKAISNQHMNFIFDVNTVLKKFMKLTINDGVIE